MSHYDPINGIYSQSEVNALSSIDLGALGELVPSNTSPNAQFQVDSSNLTTTADQLVSLAQSPLPLPYFGLDNPNSTTSGQNRAGPSPTPGMLAGMGALLASQECEPGDLPSFHLARSVIHRNGDSGEASVESLLSPPEVNLADLWLKSGQSDWMNLDQLPNGHPRKITRFSGSRPVLSPTARSTSDLKRKKGLGGDLKIAGLLQLLAKALKSKPKNYVTGLRGELLEEADEQLLGNTDVMTLPLNVPSPFMVSEDREAEKAKKEKDERERANLRRWRARKRKKNGQSSDEEELPDDGEAAENVGYINFDIFDFFEKLLSKNAAGQRLEPNLLSDEQKSSIKL